MSLHEYSVDEAPPDKESLSLVELERFLDEMSHAPAWRTRADMEADYYDGNQQTPEDIATAQERGLPIVTVNLIAPTINLVLGMEARTRTNWIVKSDGKGLTDTQAAGLSAKLAEVERNAYANRACADAYASAVKTGLGWVETSRASNPFDYPYRVKAIDRREMWWDMRSQDPLLRDARWQMRRTWNDADAIEAVLPPEKKFLIEQAMGANARWDMTPLVQSFPYLQDDLIARDWFTEDQEWRSTDRRRLCTYEMNYRKWVRGWVLKFSNGRVVQYDKKNPVHQAAVVSRIAIPEEAVFTKMRTAWWIGPFRVYDVARPDLQNDFPYTPIWGYREDRTGVPYGLVRAMVSLQNEVNARRAKMLWQLSATRVILDDDAVTDHDLTAAEVARPDAYIRLNKNRRNKAQSIEIQDHQGLSQQQFNIYEDSKRSIQQAVGVFGPMLGDAASGAEAGVAIDMLIQQGSTGLAEINDNFRLARTAIGRKLLNLVIEDMSGRPNQRIDLDKNSDRKRVVMFNKPKEIAPGVTILENDVSKLTWTIGMEEQPASTTFRQQQIKDMVEYAKSLPDELKVVFADIVIMASDLKDKEEIASRIRKITGMQPPVDPETATPEELAEAEQQAAEADKQAQLQEAAMASELDNQRADTESKRATTAKTRAETIGLVAALGLVPGMAEPAEMQAQELEGDVGDQPAAPEDQVDPKLAQMAQAEQAQAADIALGLEDQQNRPGQDRVSFGAGQ